MNTIEFLKKELERLCVSQNKTNESIQYHQEFIHTYQEESNTRHNLILCLIESISQLESQDQ